MRRTTALELWRGSRDVLRRIGVVYGFGLVVLTLGAYPGLWLMGGDWWQHLGMARAVIAGKFGPDDIARSPFFAVGSLPMLEWGGQLAMYQAYNAFAFAAACAPCLDVLLRGSAAQRSARLWILAGVAISPLCTVVMQNLWPKIFAAGLIWLSVYRARAWSQRGHMRDAIASSCWAAVAVLVHESSIIYIPLIAAVAFSRSSLASKRNLMGVLVGVFLGGALVAMWEGWTIWEFGLHARIQSNPAITYDTGLRWWHKLADNTVGILVGALPGDLASVWRNGSLPWSERAYYTAVAVVSTVGATAAGIFVLWFVWLGALVRRSFAGLLRQPRKMRMLGFAIGLVLLAHGLLLGGAPRYGAVQCGLVPLVFLLMSSLLCKIRAGHEQSARAFCRSWVVLGWLPYLVIGDVIAVLLIFRSRFPRLVERLI
ncbi:MAG TPA: hypothetical protein VHE81_12605, partial [Lacipirellulaceae bacterium]|nr:hypothetical protein [Lacipirellulaceae bacterium]